MKKSKLLSNKGQVSFELIIVLSIVLLLVTAVMLDFFEETTDSFVLTSVRTAAMKEISIFDDPSYAFCRLHSMSYAAGQITLDIEGCPIDAASVADQAEKTCGYATPDHNSEIRCGTKTYNLVIT